MKVESIYNFVFDNLKHFMFPEELINIDLEMSKQELFFLLATDKNGEITMSQFSDLLNVPMSTSTGIADRLVKKGYILRDRSQHDRRIVVIKLTKNGKKFIENLKDKIKSFISIFDDAITDDEKMLLMNIVLKIMNAFREKQKDKNKEDEKEKPIRNISID